MLDLERRQFLMVLGIALTGMLGAPAVAHAKDGDGGGDDGGGDDGGGDDGGGDDGGGDDGGNDDGGSDDGGEDGRKGGENGWRRAQDTALKAHESGRVISLKEAMKVLAKSYDGEVVDARLSRLGTRNIYTFRMKLDGGRLKTVRMDASSGRILGLFGF